MRLLRRRKRAGVKNKMTKIERFEAIDRCLFWRERKTLIVGDLHLGYEDFLAEKGWSFPKTQLEDTINILKKIFEQTGRLEEVILLGDVKHYFAGVLNGEFSDFKKIVELCNDNLIGGGRIIITKGNHDSILEPLVARWKFDNIKIMEFYGVEDVLFFHGDKSCWNDLELDKKNKLLVVGHFHPAIMLRESAKSELFKCFLRGKHSGREMIILPSFFTLVEGTDVSAGKLEKWFSVSGFKTYIVADRVYDFGKVSTLSN